MTGTVRLLRLAVAAAMATTLAVGAMAVSAEDDAAVLEELIAHETANLDAWYGASDPSMYVAEVADTGTAYDAFMPKTLMAGQELVDFYSSLEGMIPPIDYQIVDPAVDVHGDVAIFTFFLEGTNTADPDMPYGPWGTTKVMKRTADGWEMLHTHFSSPVPPPPPAE